MIHIPTYTGDRSFSASQKPGHLKLIAKVYFVIVCVLIHGVQYTQTVLVDEV